MQQKKAIIRAEPGKQELFITREFDAPRRMVFKAFTDPDLFVQWIGPRGFTTNLERFEPRNGGVWRYSQKDSQGNEYRFHGVFHEVMEPSRIIQTFEYEDCQSGHGRIRKAVFETG